MSAPLAVVDDVFFSYRVEPVLQLPHWEWWPSEHWAVVGGNGAGKTTLAKLLCDKIRPNRGSLRWGPGIDPGRDAVYVSFDLQKALIEHDVRFDDSETRADATDNGTSVRNAILQGKAPDPQFARLVDLFGLAPIIDRGIRVLSTGEGRKTLLARALFSQPRLLILDNPLEGLDRRAVVEFTELLEHLLEGATPLLLLLPEGATIPRGISHVLHLRAGEPIYAGPLADYRPSTAEPGSGAELPLPPPLQREAPPAIDAAPIRMAGVNVSFQDQPVLNDIHWTLARGQHCSISGRNGAGKSTLLSLITGESHKAYGQPLWLFGRQRGSGESVWEIKANCGVVNTPLQLNYTGRQRVLEVVASGLYDTVGLFRDCSGRERELTQAWIQAVGLEAMATERFDQLSFGQQRLALLARAMVKSPPLLILDEPCLGLDASHRRHFLALVDRIAASGPTQILFVSHDPNDLPACINQWLALVPHEGGGSTARVSDRPVE